jgi:hypothetical protein
MNPRFLSAVVVVAVLNGALGAARSHGQPIGSRNSNWSPYRPLATVAQLQTDVLLSDQPELGEVKPSQYEECPPCPPGYSEFITDTDLQSMRGSRGGYVMQPAIAAPMMMAPNNCNPFMAAPGASSNWDWEVLPSDVIWHSYMAGMKEPRMSGVFFEELNGNMTLLDVTLGGRASVLRYGTRANGQAEGFEIQIEGAGQPRLNLDEDWDLEAADFRFGVPLVYGNDRVQFKLSYYHISSHLGDEFIERTGIPASDRINYARDAVVIGTSFFPLPAWRLYAEAEWAFYADEGADPWAFQFGVDYAQPGPTGIQGTPFFAVNGHLREEVDYGGTMVAQAGWLWRGNQGHTLRTGVHYQNGKSNQFEFSDEFEQQIGAGLWYDY